MISAETAQAVLLSGIILGSLYAIMATGLALVWSTLGIFNFAHGVFMTLGAYIAWQFAHESGFGFGYSAGVAIGITFLFGVGIVLERILIRPFIGKKDIVMLVVITTLAAYLILENSILLTWGARFKQLPPIIEGTVDLLSTSISTHEFIVLILSPLILLLLWCFLKFTRVGTAIRAVSQNRESALLMGIKVNYLYSIAFGLSAALAGVAGILIGSTRYITPFLGNDPLLKALIVAIFGGLGSLSGTILAAYVIGILEAISIFYIGLYWTPTILFLFMIIMLVIRPEGLLGKGSNK